ncbi:MAG: hypothetical protein AABZ92_00230 [Verrucomicrobiota bacterium]
MINLRFKTKLVTSEQYGYVPTKIIRLIAKVRFLKADNSLSKAYRALVDTGAHTSTIPATIWKEIKFTTKTEDAWLSGINDRPECRVLSSIADVEGLLLDDENNHTKLLQFSSFLTKTDRTPLLLGVAGILENYRLHWDYQSNIAYLQKKRKKQ